MQNQYTSETLKEAINALEVRQKEEEKLLQLQLINVYENLKPINIIKNLVNDVATTDNIKHDIINTFASLMSGFISKKIVVGKSKNPFLKLIGLGIQLGMTTLVSKNYDVIKDIFAQLVDRIQEKKAVED